MASATTSRLDVAALGERRARRPPRCGRRPPRSVGAAGRGCRRARSRRCRAGRTVAGTQRAIWSGTALTKSVTATTGPSAVVEDLGDVGPRGALRWGAAGSSARRRARRRAAACSWSRSTRRRRRRGRRRAGAALRARPASRCRWRGSGRGGSVRRRRVDTGTGRGRSPPRRRRASPASGRSRCRG